MSSFLKGKSIEDNSGFIFGKNHFINNISLGFILIFAEIEVYKIAAIVSSSAIVISLLFLCAISTVIFLVQRMDFSKLKISKYTLPAFLAFVIFLTAAISIFLITPNILNTPDVQTWMTNFSLGHNPYLESSDKYFPMIYFILSPFEMIGNLLISNVAAIGIFVFVLIWVNKELEESIITVLLLFLLPEIYVQLSQGSVEMLFTALSLLIFILPHWDEGGKSDPLSNTIISIICGILLLTLQELAPVILLWMIFTYRQNFTQLLLITGLSLLTAGILYFVIFNFNWELIGETPLTDNVFTELGWIFSALYLSLIIYGGWMVSNLRELTFTGGLLVVLLWSASILYQWNKGTAGLFQLVIYENIRFIFNVFFLFLISIHKYRTDRFLGRVYPVKNNV